MREKKKKKKNHRQKEGQETKGIYSPTTVKHPATTGQKNKSYQDDGMVHVGRPQKYDGDRSHGKEIGERRARPTNKDARLDLIF